MTEPYTYTPEMGEISGFGGGYEDTCRRMVVAGLQCWDQEGDDFDPRFSGFEGVYGLIQDDNADAKVLTEAMLAAAGEGITGAMHHACVQHVLAARRLGWVEYARQMAEREEE